jgi:hypothetical protein
MFGGKCPRVRNHPGGASALTLEVDRASAAEVP